MKKSLTLILILFASTYLFSQSFEVTHESYGQLSNDAEYTVVGDTSIETMETHLSIKNISASSIDSKVKKYVVSEVAGSTNDFCWGEMCYPPNTFVSQIVTLAAGDSSMFDGHYKSNKNTGTTVVRYTVFDNDSLNDSLSVVVRYEVTSVGIDVMEDIKFSNAYPNPANNYAYFNYSIPQGSNAKLVVFDLLGSVVIDKKITNHNGTLKIDTYKLINGVYFYSLITENKTIFTRKLVVNH